MNIIKNVLNNELLEEQKIADKTLPTANVTKSLQIKNSSGNIVGIVSDIDSLKMVITNPHMGEHIIKAISTGELDQWFRRNDYLDLANMLKCVEKHGFSIYVNTILSWAQQEKLGSYSMDSLVGYGGVKQSLTGDVKKLFLKKSKGFSAFSPEHTLLFGPPGCGKTKLALASVKELNAYCINQNISSLDGMPGILNGFFKIARSAQKSVLILDEVEQVSMKISETEINQLGNCMLNNLDGAEDNKNLFVIGITNYPWVMDPALLRAGRFSKRIFVGPPNDSERELLFKNYLKDFKTKNLDLKILVEKTNNYSCADIKQICFYAGQLAFKKNPDSKKAPTIEMNQLLKAVKETPSTIIYWAEKASAIQLPDYAKKYFPGMIEFLKKYADDNFQKGVPAGTFS